MFLIILSLFAVALGCSSSFRFEAFSNVQSCKDCYNCLAGINPIPIAYNCEHENMVLTVDSEFMFRCNCYPRSVIVTNLDGISTSVLVTVPQDEIGYYIGVINGSMTSITLYTDTLSLTLERDSAIQYIPYSPEDGVIGVSIKC